MEHELRPAWPRNEMHGQSLQQMSQPYYDLQKQFIGSSSLGPQISGMQGLAHVGCSLDSGAWPHAMVRGVCLCILLGDASTPWACLGELHSRAARQALPAYFLRYWGCRLRPGAAGGAGNDTPECGPVAWISWSSLIWAFKPNLWMLACIIAALLAKSLSTRHAGAGRRTYL